MRGYRYMYVEGSPIQILNPTHWNLYGPQHDRPPPVILLGGVTASPSPSCAFNMARENSARVSFFSNSFFLHPPPPQIFSLKLHNSKLRNLKNVSSCILRGSWNVHETEIHVFLQIFFKRLGVRISIIHTDCYRYSHTLDYFVFYLSAGHNNVN
jgi:hypothetical protein